MDFRGCGLFWTLGRSASTLQQSEGGRVTVDWTTILALLVTIVLVGYLAIALLLPEKFS